MELSLHDKQLEVFNDDHKFKVLTCGRRFGKSHLQVTKTVTDAISFPELMPDYDIKSQTMETISLVAMPTLKQAKRILWKPIVKVLKDSPLVESINRTEHVVTFVGNRPDIVLAGLNDGDGDRARGSKLWRVAIDEVQDVKPEIFDAVIYPAMADTPRSAALFTGTPKGKVNHLYELFRREKQFDDWKSFNYPTWVNPYVPTDEITRAYLTMPRRLFEQEFMASFVNFEGQFYGEFDEDDHVVDDLPESFDSFYIGHDCGDVNPAYVVIGKSGDKYYLVETRLLGDGVNAVPSDIVYAKINDAALRWGDRVRRVFVDPSRPQVVIDLREFPTMALRRAIRGYNAVIDGIQTVHSLFHQDRFFIWRGCGKGIVELLQSYHRKKDKNGHFIDVVEDGQNDHELDAIRYVLATLENRKPSR